MYSCFVGFWVIFYVCLFLSRLFLGLVIDSQSEVTSVSCRLVISDWEPYLNCVFSPCGCGFLFRVSVSAYVGLHDSCLVLYLRALLIKVIMFAQRAAYWSAHFQDDRDNMIAYACLVLFVC